MLKVTGLAETPDGKTPFVNIQHPGADTAPANIGDPTLYASHRPDDGLARPRSATVAITRKDKGLIGLRAPSATLCGRGLRPRLAFFGPAAKRGHHLACTAATDRRRGRGKRSRG